jgi:nitroreductase
MPDFMSIVKERRSVRKYEDKEISPDLLHKVLESVQWAPSWANTQCWEVVVVKDGATKERLKETVGPKNPATNAVAEAPVVLAVCGKLGVSGFYKDRATTKFGDWFMFDLGLAVQNLCLAAHHLGLGTVVVGLFDHDKAREVLAVPGGYEVVVLVPVGYPAKISNAPKRKEISEFARHDKFQ